jgi:hypothetical protein
MVKASDKKHVLELIEDLFGKLKIDFPFDALNPKICPSIKIVSKKDLLEVFIQNDPQICLKFKYVQERNAAGDALVGTSRLIKK